MIWDLIQQSQIGHAKAVADDAKSTAAENQRETRLLDGRVEKLVETVDRLSLACMALAEILRERLDITEADIEAKVQEIDLRDGKLDGRLRASTNDCPQCHHTNSSNRRKCLYCGETLPYNSGISTSTLKETTSEVDLNSERN